MMRKKDEILRDERKKVYPKSIPLGELEVLIDIRDLLNDLLCEIRDFKEIYNSS